MLRNKKVIAVLMTLFVFITGVFAQTIDLTTRYLDQASAAFEDGDIDTAYKRINGALALCMADSGSIPANVNFYAKSIYKAKLKKLIKNYDNETFVELKVNLEKYEDVNDGDITRQIRLIEAAQSEKEKQAAIDQQKEFQDSLKNSLVETAASGSEALKNTMDDLSKQLVEQNEKQNEILEKNAEQTRQFNEKISEAVIESSQKTQSSLKIIFIVILAVIVLILLIVLLIVAIVRAAAKQSKIQNQQYVEAFKLLASNQSQTNQLMIGGIAGLYGDDGLKLAGTGTWSEAALPEPEDSAEEKEELRNLAAKCEEVGAQIDQITGRKNNSKNVSELVFKIATKLGVRHHDAMVYFCASMVYDAGFLDVDPELLQAEQLTPEQKKALNRHVDNAVEHLQFVPKRYWEVFENAARLHHENFDGTGMPEGLKGEEIPAIARIIRVADSFNALSSRRSFRGGTDKESALEILEQQPNVYDQDVIKALKDII